MDKKAVANTVSRYGRAQDRSAAPYQAQENAAGQRERGGLNDEEVAGPDDRDHHRHEETAGDQGGRSTGRHDGAEPFGLADVEQARRRAPDHQIVEVVDGGVPHREAEAKPAMALAGQGDPDDKAHRDHGSDVDDEESDQSDATARPEVEEGECPAHNRHEQDGEGHGAGAEPLHEERVVGGLTGDVTEGQQKEEGE
jgi:hypothetical protein